MLLSISSCSFERVTSGHVGVKVQNVGSGSGVDPQPLSVGWYFTPPGTSIYEYKVYAQPYTYQKVPFQDKNGLSIDADIAISYQANPALAPKLFQQYRVEMDSIILGAVYNEVKDAISKESGVLTVDQIYGAEKGALLDRAATRVRNKLGKYGIQIESMTWASRIRLPITIQNQINARVANEQEALAAEANVKTATARAKAGVEAAKGKAEALKIEQEAIQNSPQIVELRAVEKWNGVLPTTMVPGSSVPFIGKVAK
ncbi:hypothetical protein WP12_12100 [Sphingomonas sp. SRS2]|nr:hypothetical protein WP12_12100 [Sphingomonas sp. SRS2]